MKQHDLCKLNMDQNYCYYCSRNFNQESAMRCLDINMHVHVQILSEDIAIIVFKFYIQPEKII